MKLSEFNYSLPDELIAQQPADKRDQSRLMIVDRKKQKISHHKFYNISDYLSKEDLIVLNNTKVLSSRLLGRKLLTNGKVEMLLLNNIGDNCYTALVKPSRLKQDDKIVIDKDISCFLFGRTENGLKIIKFNSEVNVEALFEKKGIIPLPPYIKRIPEDFDIERYQTVYAKHKGAVAAPTAGLHFTSELLNSFREKGIDIAYLTLHVGYGTFKPVVEDDITKHNIHSEYFVLPKETADLINKTKESGHKVLCVGTTTTRAVEAASAGTAHRAVPATGWTDIFIYPGYEFKTTDMLLTNFHLPKTTLLMLVSAFCGKELLFKAYDTAIKEKYRFYSYGDAMLII